MTPSLQHCLQHWHGTSSFSLPYYRLPTTATLGCVVLQALMHAREYPLGSIDVDEPRDLTSSPPLLPPRHRLAGPPSTWLTGDWQGVRSGLRFHPGTQHLFANQISYRTHHKQLLQTALRLHSADGFDQSEHNSLSYVC